MKPFSEVMWIGILGVGSVEMSVFVPAESSLVNVVDTGWVLIMSICCKLP